MTASEGKANPRFALVSIRWMGRKGSGVTHYTATACTTHHEIEFEYLMPMDGIVELLLMAIRNIHEVVLAEWCNLT